MQLQILFWKSTKGVNEMILALRIFIVLLLIGSVFGLVNLTFFRDNFLFKYPNFDNPTLSLFSFLPLLSLPALIGLWFWQKWAVNLIAACSVLVIVADIYFNIWSHLYIAIPSSLILAFLVYKNWNNFKNDLAN
jgi:uncharacterized membrane protein YqjE